MPAKPFIWLIKLYQRFVSPLLPSSCKYYPSCSRYAVDALEAHGLLKGTLMAAWRVLRCNPFSKGGFDPVTPPTECNQDDAASRAVHR